MKRESTKEESEKGIANWKAHWKAILSLMLSEYHEDNPGDRRSDREILDDLMDYFVKTGTIKKDDTGKYLLPEITYL